MSFALLTGLLLILYLILYKYERHDRDIAMVERKLSLEDIFGYIESQCTLIHTAPKRYQCTMQQWLMIKYKLNQMEKGNVSPSSQASPQASVKQLPPPSQAAPSPVQDAQSGEVTAEGRTSGGDSQEDAVEGEEVISFILMEPDEFSFTGAEPVVNRLPPVG